MMACPAHKATADLAEVLDRPVWTSLTSCHAGFAFGQGAARRLMVEAGPFAAARDDRPESIEALEQLVVAHGGKATLMQAGEPAVQRALPNVVTAPAVQMVAGPLLQPRICCGAVRLTGTDTPEMQALAALANPGPFEELTHLLGRFWGIRRGNRLVAMAGERLKQRGFTEISAVSVHPDYRGQGLGSALVRNAAAQIVARSETPYLHALADNTGAIRIYERVGFRVRIDMTVTWLSATTDNPEIKAEPHDKVSDETRSFEET